MSNIVNQLPVFNKEKIVIKLLPEKEEGFAVRYVMSPLSINAWTMDIDKAYSFQSMEDAKEIARILVKQGNTVFVQQFEVVMTCNKQQRFTP